MDARNEVDVLITGTLMGTGKYTGKVIMPPESDIDPDEDLTADDFGDAHTPAYGNLYVANAGEVGFAGHSVETGMVCKGRILRRQTDDTTWISINIPTGPFYRVKQTGGAGGSDGVFPTWTYDLYAKGDSTVDGTPIATGVVVQKRLFPVFLNAAADDSICEAVKNGVTWIITTIAESTDDVVEMDCDGSGSGSGSGASGSGGE